MQGAVQLCAHVSRRCLGRFTTKSYCIVSRPQLEIELLEGVVECHCMLDGTLCPHQTSIGDYGRCRRAAWTEYCDFCPLPRYLSTDIR
jgi:hypothetical protein